MGITKRAVAKGKGGGGGGDVISMLGNAIKKSNEKIDSGVKNIVNTVKVEVAKPEFKDGLQKAVKVAVGVASLTPVGKRLVMASVAIADKVTGNNSASSYVGTDKNNSTLSMVPGGLLFQQVLEVADP